MTKLKPKQKVKDTWFQELGIGKIIKVTQRRVYVLFNLTPDWADDKGIAHYDHEHANCFLKPIKQINYE